MMFCFLEITCLNLKTLYWFPSFFSHFSRLILLLPLFSVTNIVKDVPFSCQGPGSWGQHCSKFVSKTGLGIPEKDCFYWTPLEIPINVAIWRTHSFTVDPVSILCCCCDNPIMKAQLTTNSCYSAFHVPDFLQFLLQLIIFVSLLFVCSTKPIIIVLFLHLRNCYYYHY